MINSSADSDELPTSNHLRSFGERWYRNVSAYNRSSWAGSFPPPFNGFDWFVNAGAMA